MHHRLRRTQPAARRNRHRRLGVDLGQLTRLPVPVHRGQGAQHLVNHIRPLAVRVEREMAGTAPRSHGKLTVRGHRPVLGVEFIHHHPVLTQVGHHCKSIGVVKIDRMRVRPRLPGRVRPERPGMLKKGGPLADLAIGAQSKGGGAPAPIVGAQNHLAVIADLDMARAAATAAGLIQHRQFAGGALDRVRVHRPHLLALELIELTHRVKKIALRMNG